MDEQPDFTSSYTSNFPALLRELGISLMVSTYQAGKVILVRAQGEELNTHFRTFQRPMGIAWDAESGRLAIGTGQEVWTFGNQPALAARLEPVGTHDAAFMPRVRYTTGDISIHEMGWSGDTLWAVNTRFSCLCTFDGTHSFVPRWKPAFVTALAAEDRCHLNGMAMVDGEVRLVTCLAATDVAGAWRGHKLNGGMILSVPDGEVLVRGLSMPHSPRWHAGALWFLESGRGTLSIADPSSGKTQIVTTMPGFTRGMAFHGHLAFIGLSQVRESAIFSGIPLVESHPERMCGVWVVDIRSGATVAFLRFEGVVQEIFAVEVIHGIQYPELFNELGPESASAFVLPAVENTDDGRKYGA